MKTKKLSIFWLFLLLLASTGNAYAFDSFNIADNFGPAGIFPNVGALATFIVKLLTMVVGILSFVFIIISGIKIVTSSGDSKKLGSATSTLLYAIVGLAVAILAFVIINLVQKFIGSSISIT